MICPANSSLKPNKKTKCSTFIDDVADDVVRVRVRVHVHDVHVRVRVRVRVRVGVVHVDVVDDIDDVDVDDGCVHALYMHMSV